MTTQRFKKPTIEEVVEYCLEQNNGIDGEEFWLFYESKGWVIGKSPMKNWKMAIATWVKRKKKDVKTFNNKGVRKVEEPEWFDRYVEELIKMN